MALNPYVPLLDKWPEPIALTHAPGDAFVVAHQEPGYIEAKWTGSISAADIIAAGQLSISLFETTHHPGLLNDKSEATGEWYEANDWLQYEWFPQVIEAGLKYFAHVHPKIMFSLYSTRDLFKRIPPEMQMQFFYTHEAAKAWLQEKIKIK